MSHANENPGKENTAGRKLHRDWRMWAIVLLMLGSRPLDLQNRLRASLPYCVP